ncbi:sulfotransferase family protein [Mycobacterium sp. SMC-4]|uniref:sulfotransferase family protein n=1 Tax=Mycobacterium sp. SMC-4 TaxID=2857059 RepID=UPI003D00FC37
MRGQMPQRSSTARQIYAEAEKDRAENPQRYQFDVDRVVDRATRRGEFSPDDFAAGWRSGLEAFLGSAEQDGRLNAVGIRMALQSATGRLTAGARIARYRREHPEVCAVEMAPPIVIIGGWRTGTTFLFRLLGSDPRLHAPLPAELVAPWRFASPDHPQASEISATTSSLLHTLNPDMAVVHPSGPALPEECVLGMGTDLRNWGFTSMMRLPSYAEWLAGQDFSGTYSRYRDGLQLLACGDPRRFVLKAPAHTAELDHLIETFPGLTVVQIHRDIVSTLTSGASLFAVYRATYSDEVDPIEVGRQQLDQSELWFRRAVEVRRETPADAATFLDIDYRDLVDNPARVVGRVYAAAGMSPPDDLDGFIDDYHRAHPRDAGGHRYTAEEFGIRADEVWERFAFLDEIALGRD